jgi:hypothetical protein
MAVPFLAIAGCVGPDPLSGPPRPSRDVLALTAAMSSEQLLIYRYKAVIAAYPSLAHPLKPLLSQHDAHLAQLRGRLIVPPGASPPPSPSPAQSAAAPTVPGTAAGAAAFLQATERDAAAAQVRRLAEVAPSLAQLMASIAACEATHAAALGPLRRGFHGQVTG